MTKEKVNFSTDLHLLKSTYQHLARFYGSVLKVCRVVGLKLATYLTRGTSVLQRIEVKKLRIAHDH